jgi:hypothetical protein
MTVVDKTGTLTLWEGATGQMRGRYREEPGCLLGIYPAPGGSRLALTRQDTTVLIVDPVLLGAKPELAKLPLNKLWEGLAGADAEAAWGALCILVKAEKAVPFLKEKLPPLEPVARERVARLIRQLEDENFETRERATAELTGLLEQVAPALEDELKEKLPPETHRRIRQLLDKRSNGLTPEMLRQLRALEALQLMHTPEAKALLEKIAAGDPVALRTREAKAALSRWDR